MSRWTYITATIVVDTFANKKDIKKYAERKLENAPKIRGSEEDANIYVNKLDGYNTLISEDCNRCKYGKLVKRIDDKDIFKCLKPNNVSFECPEGEYQTEVCITIVGYLRDRKKEDVLKEYIDFLNYITKDLRFYISIRCEYIEEFTCNEDENTIYAIENGKIIS